MTNDSARPVVTVTGGTGGVGRAAVREFATDGNDMAVPARGQASLDAAADRIVQPEAHGVFGDKAAVHDPVSFLARYSRAALAGAAAALLAGGGALLRQGRP